MEQTFTQFAVKILCDDSTAFDEVDDYFATEADTMIDIIYEDDLDGISFEYLHLTGTFTQLFCLNVKLQLSMSPFLYFIVALDCMLTRSVVNVCRQIMKAGIQIFVDWHYVSKCILWMQ